MRITEGKLRQIIREKLIQEADESPVLYTGIILKPDFVYALRNMIIGLGYDEDIDGWELSNIAAHGNEQLNHHMTLTVGALKPNDPLKDSLGKEVKLRVIGWGVDPHAGVAAWKVEPHADIPVKTGNPHITAALSGPDVKPFLASKIKDWQTLDEPFTVVGTLQEVRAKLSNTLPATVDDTEQRYFVLTPDNAKKIGDILITRYNRYLTLDELKKIGDMLGVSIKYIDRGRHRIVYSINDRFVVKIATCPTGYLANKEDYVLGKDRTIGHIVPASFFHDDNFSWIVVEQVTPCKSYAEVAIHFRSKYLIDPETQGSNYMHFILEVILDYKRFTDNALAKDAEETINLSEQVLLDDGSFERDTVTVGDIRRDLIKQPTFLNLDHAIKKYGIQIEEIDKSNMGIADDGSLVLLDSSIS